MSGGCPNCGFDSAIHLRTIRDGAQESNGMFGLVNPEHVNDHDEFLLHSQATSVIRCVHILGCQECNTVFQRVIR